MAIVTVLAGNLLLWAWLTGAALLWVATRGRGRWRRLALGGWLAAWILTCRPAVELVLWPLESRYPPVDAAEIVEHGVTQVVVLTGGGFAAPTDLLSDTLPPASASRFLAGVELCALQGPDCRLIFSGSAGRGNRGLRTADGMRELAHRLGVGGEIVAESVSGSTAEHPGNVRPLLRGDAFVLVTSAYHMPRAMGSFRRSGLEPVAFPVASRRRGGYGWQDFLPSAEGLRILQVAWREYLALVFYGARGV